MLLKSHIAQLFQIRSSAITVTVDVFLTCYLAAFRGITSSWHTMRLAYCQTNHNHSYVCCMAAADIVVDTRQVVLHTDLYQHILLYQFDFEKCCFIGIASLLWTIQATEIRLISMRVEHQQDSAARTNCTAEKRNCLDRTYCALYIKCQM